MDEVRFQQHGSSCRMWVPPEIKDKDKGVYPFCMAISSQWSFDSQPATENPVHLRLEFGYRPAPGGV